MHRSAVAAIKAFFSSYPLPAGAKVLDLAANDPAQTIRNLLPAAVSYVGADTHRGAGVEVLIEDTGYMPFYEEHFHAVISCYRLEHDAFFWLSFTEILRVLKPGGLLLLCAPSNGLYHRSPADNWRLYPDAGKALEAWGRKQGHAVELLESFILPQSDNEPWNDFVAVFQKGGAATVQPAMHALFPAATNLWLQAGSFPQRIAKLPEDRRKLQEAAYGSRKAITSAPEPTRCNICNGSDFGAGPAGRMASSGKPPHCNQCDSLERQRIMHAVLQALPAGFLDWRHALRIGPNNGDRDSWFRSQQTLSFASGRSTTLDTQGLPGHSIDFISFSHMLEFLPDARASFDELLRLLTPNGIMLASFAAPLQRERSEDFQVPVGQHGARHLFGKDLARYFECERHQLQVLVAEETDPCTGTREAVHLFIRQPADLAKLRAWLTSWNGTLTVVRHE